MDQDDSMMSTPSSPPEDLDDSILPESADQVRALTPQNDHLNASAPGELSPPRSQPHSHVTVSRSRNTVDNGNNDDEGLGDEISGAGAAGSMNTTGAEGEWRAGTWKSKKDQDEMQKIWETNYVDRDFSLAVFGDVLEHKIPGEGGKQVQK